MLKKFLVAIAAIAGFQAAALSINIQLLDVQALNTQILDEVRTQGLPWKVGDTAEYSLNLGGFIDGSMVMLVREETAEGVWLQQDIDLQFQKQKVETLFDKETGQVKRVLVDGQEQKIEGGEAPEIVESKPDTITVPAGTFECSFIKLKDKKQGTTTDLWLNPELVPIVGLIKQVAQSQLGPVTLELKGFGKK